MAPDLINSEHYFYLVEIICLEWLVKHSDKNAVGVHTSWVACSVLTLQTWVCEEGTLSSCNATQCCNRAGRDRPSSLGRAAGFMVLDIAHDLNQRLIIPQHLLPPDSSGEEWGWIQFWFQVHVLLISCLGIWQFAWQAHDYTRNGDKRYTSISPRPPPLQISGRPLQLLYSLTLTTSCYPAYAVLRFNNFPWNQCHTIYKL